MDKLKHIGIIPDGNRRYATKNALNFGDAYQKGITNLLNTVEYLSKVEDLEIVSVYGMSLDNYQKRENERKIIFKLIDEMLKKAINEKMFDKYGVEIRFIGEKELFPDYMQEKIEKIEKETKGNKNLKLNIALAYSGKKEVENAVKKGGIEKIKENLYIPEDLDLVIRTGGFQRLSDFMIMQSSYSELYFTDKLWPEFNSEELKKAIDFFNNTKRNFGK